MFHHVAGTLPHTTPSSDYEVVPYWRVTAANVQVSRLPESEWLMDNYAVLNITVRVGVVVLNSLRTFRNLSRSWELRCRWFSSPYYNICVNVYCVLLFKYISVQIETWECNHC